MTLVDQFHSEHKARLIRLGAMPKPAAPEPEPTPPAVEPLPPIPNFYIAAAADMAFPKFAFSGTIKTIQRIAAEEFAPVTVTDINSQRRTAPVVRARQVAMYVAKEMTARSLPEIGRRFGGRDHTTVLHAVRKIRNLIPTDAALAAQVNRIIRAVEVAFEANTYI